MARSILETHAETIRTIDSDFQMYKLINSDNGLNFESNPPNYWLISRGSETLEVTLINGMHTIKIRRNTKLVNDEILVDVYAENINDKYWSGDLYYFVTEAFGVGSFLVNSDMKETDKRRFFTIALSLLSFIREPDPKGLLTNINRHTMDSSSIAYLLKSTLESVALKVENEDAKIECLLLVKELRELDKVDKNNENKLTIMLDGCERIISEYM